MNLVPVDSGQEKSVVTLTVLMILCVVCLSIVVIFQPIRVTRHLHKLAWSEYKIPERVDRR